MEPLKCQDQRATAMFLSENVCSNKGRSDLFLRHFRFFSSISRLRPTSRCIYLSLAGLALRLSSPPASCRLFKVG
jgi:hypothetical protein